MAGEVLQQQKKFVVESCGLFFDRLKFILQYEKRFDSTSIQLRLVTFDSFVQKEPDFFSEIV